MLPVIAKIPDDWAPSGTFASGSAAGMPALCIRSPESLVRIGPGKLRLTGSAVITWVCDDKWPKTRGFPQFFPQLWKTLPLSACRAEGWRIYHTIRRLTIGLAVLR